jgi:AcrR family transcriptional regulator
MPRVIKHPEVRRAELLGVARGLFFERGYDATTVDDVIAKAGLSKGAFYYYFPSKDALLEALAEQMAKEALVQLDDILDDPTLNAVERLNGFLSRGRQLKAEQAPQILAMFETVFRPENVVLYHRTHAAVTAVMVPVLTSIIEQGISEGRFRVAHARTTAEIVLMLGAVTHDAVARLLVAKGDEESRAAVAAFEQRLTEQGIAVDRILGLPDGTVRFVEPGFTEAVFGSRAVSAAHSARIATR